MPQRYKKLSTKQRNLFLFLSRRSNFASFDAKIRKKNETTKLGSPIFFDDQLKEPYFLQKQAKNLNYGSQRATQTRSWKALPSAPRITP